MLKDLFIPEKIGTYYITPKHIIGFEITQSYVYACHLKAQAKKITIEQCFSEPIARQGDKEKNIEQALHHILTQTKGTIHSCVVSSHAIFKTLILPFTSREKIAKVIPYEIEPVLPFSIKNAAIDFVITRTNTNPPSAEILVVAVQNKYIQRSLLPFQALGHEVSLLTLDMIALYQLYKRIPEYAQFPGVTLLIDLSIHETRLVYIRTGQLKFIRTLPKGLPSYLDKAAKQLKLSESEAMGLLTSVKQDTKKQTIENLIEPFWQEVSFTISSFRSQINTPVEERIMLLGEGSSFHNVEKLFNQKLHIPTTLFQINKLVHTKEIAVKNKESIPPSNIISIAVALPSALDEELNLARHESTSSELTNIFRQLIVSGTLCLSIIVVLLTFSFFQTRKFKKELARSIQETTHALITMFGNKIEPRGKRTLTPVRSLNSIVDNADKEVAAKEKMWFAFAAPAQVTYLRHLYELFTGLNQEALGLEIKKIELREGTMTLEGKVKDYDALVQFDQFIQSSPFLGRIVRGSLQEPEFNIDIELNKTGKAE